MMGAEVWTTDTLGMLRAIADEQVRTNALLERIAVAVEARVPAARLATDRPKRERAPVFSAESQEFGFARRMYVAIFGNSVQANEARLLQGWSKEFDLIFRVDKRVPAEVERVRVFAAADAFWSGVILSPRNLRKHYLRILKAMKPAARPAQFERVEKKL